MIKWIDNLLHPYKVNETNINNADIYTQLIARIEKLENENIELTNCLYEIMQSIDDVNIKIDKIHPVIYNLHQKE